MSEFQQVSGGYPELFPQIKALVEGETDLVANLANVAAALHSTFPFLWTGFYLVKENELVLGPFQGPVACSRIALGHGVCGTAWKEARTIVVPDVEKFPDHIACSSLSRSEIVIPIKVGSAVVAVLDVDSENLEAFNENDAKWLEAICEVLAEHWR